MSEVPNTDAAKQLLEERARRIRGEHTPQTPTETLIGTTASNQAEDDRDSEEDESSSSNESQNSNPLRDYEARLTRHQRENRDRGGRMSRDVHQSASSAVVVLDRQIRTCERHINDLIDAGNDTEERVPRVIEKIELLNQHRTLLRRFTAGDTLSRTELKLVFDIIRRAYEFEMLHPAPERPSGRGRAEAERELMAAMSAALGGTARRGGPIEFGAFSLGGERNGSSNAAMRNMLQQLGAPASFWEDIPIPMEQTTLEKIPSQTFASFVQSRTAASREHNKECNICMEEYQENDQIRVFPCCELAQHTKCLETWFKDHDVCVVCRKKTAEVLGLPETTRTAPPPSSGSSSSSSSYPSLASIFSRTTAVSGRDNIRLYRPPERPVAPDVYRPGVRAPRYFNVPEVRQDEGTDDDDDDDDNVHVCQEDDEEDLPPLTEDANEN